MKTTKPRPPLHYVRDVEYDVTSYWDGVLLSQLADPSTLLDSSTTPVLTSTQKHVPEMFK